MQTKDILRSIREKNNLTQSEMADRLMITRQAVSRWETGETLPNTETLKIISREFNVSINTLLGQPESLVCQCCGMPLYEDGVISREENGDFNEEYCKWCYEGGEFVYKSVDQLVDYVVPNIVMKQNPDADEDEEREKMRNHISQLKHWSDK